MTTKEMHICLLIILIILFCIAGIIHLSKFLIKKIKSRNSKLDKVNNHTFRNTQSIFLMLYITLIFIPGVFFLLNLLTMGIANPIYIILIQFINLIIICFFMLRIVFFNYFFFKMLILYKKNLTLINYGKSDPIVIPFKKIINSEIKRIAVFLGKKFLILELVDDRKKIIIPLNIKNFDRMYRIISENFDKK